MLHRETGHTCDSVSLRSPDGDAGVEVANPSRLGAMVLSASFVILLAMARLRAKLARLRAAAASLKDQGIGVEVGSTSDSDAVLVAAVLYAAWMI